MQLVAFKTDVRRPTIDEITVIELSRAEYWIKTHEIDLEFNLLGQWSDPLIVYKLEGRSFFFWRDGHYEDLAILLPKLFPNDLHSQTMFKLRYG